MKLWATIWRQLRLLGRRGAVKREIDEELRFHLEQRTAENIASGMSPEEAAQAARKRFGNLQSVREECHDARGTSFGEAIWRDIRFAGRQLSRRPGFTTVATLTLAICVGANLAIFTVVDAILVRSLPFPQPERLMVIHNAFPASGVNRGEAGITDYFERRGSIEALESISLFREESYIVGEREAARRIQGAEITPEFFATLGTPLAVGQGFTDEELNYGTDGVAIITDKFWRDYFGAASNVLGRTFLSDGLIVRVIGILPAGFRYLSTKAQVYRPLSHFRETRDLVSHYAPGTHMPDGRSPVTRYTARARQHDGQMVARLRAGRSMAEAEAQLNVLNERRLARDPLGQTLQAAAYYPRVEPLRSAHVSAVRPVVILAQTGALILLLLGGSNLAGLLHIRASGRIKEMAVRQALGAGRGSIARATLTETILLSLMGGAGGVLLAVIGLRLAVAFGTDTLPLGADIVFNLRAVLMAILVSGALGIGMGLPIVWLHLRGATSLSLQSETRGATTNPTIQRLRHGLLATQIVVACMLLYGAGLLGMSLRQTLSRSPGFQTEQVVTGHLILPWAHYQAESSRVAFIHRLLGRVRAIPGVSHAAISSALPFTKGGSAPRGLLPEGFAPTPSGDLRVHYTSTVTGDYWKTMGIPLLKGRFIEDADSRENAPKVAVIDEALARRYWPNGEAIGQRFSTDPSIFNPEVAHAVVGIVGSVKQQDLAETAGLGAVYLPYDGFPAFQVVVRSSGSTVTASTLQELVRQLDPGLPLIDFKSMRARVDDSLMTRRAPAMLAAIFATVALLLAGIGTYGVLAYAVSQRRREIAVRLACGATPKQIGRRFLVLGLNLLVPGLVLGVFGSWAVGRAMTNLLVEVPSLHVSTAAGTVLLLAVTTLVAAYFPARRAAGVAPMEALRHE